MAKKIATTTRSYTLRLAAPSDSDSWLPLWQRLFQAHYSVCKGTEVFGQFYLNLRGGLSASLAACLDEQDKDRQRVLQRGARRMLALGWLSVESMRGAENHPHRVREAGPGQSLSRELAENLLRDILRNYKGVSPDTDVTDWVNDCVLALTANIRHDAVFVNRAAAFAEWQTRVGNAGAAMPEQARQILFSVCGEGFVSLTLPDEAIASADKTEADADASDPDNEESPTSLVDAEEAAEPSNASRGVFGDLFGGDAHEKLSRAAGKEEFAVRVRAMLTGLGTVAPAPETIVTFRNQHNLPPLDTSRPDKYPQEVSSSGAPTDVSKRYRKLLVCLNLWPTSPDESGAPRAQAVARFAKQVTSQDESTRSAYINSQDLIEACRAPTVDGHNNNGESKSQRVFTPAWAPDLALQLTAATSMPTNAKPLNEFKRLMFALAARRISQTQSWTKRNEAERHNAAVKEDAARSKLEELDSDGHARAWLAEYEDGRADRSRALSDFRVTRRMIGECDAVFDAWKRTKTEDERTQCIAALQAESEKFGDPRFYADISAATGVAAIWNHAHGAEILKQWVKLRQAQYDQQRFKIPRFCHPDPFHHPTWCEFGGSSKPKVWYAWKPDSKPQNPEAGGDADGSRRLWMLLPDSANQQAKAVPMRWRSKRLSKDLGEVRDGVEKSISRADRLGLASANLPLADNAGKLIRYRPHHPFTTDAKGWNARLQIDRGSLEALERHWDDSKRIWRDSGNALKHARWFVTFAPALASSNGLGRNIHPKLAWKSNPHTDLNKKQKREGHAKLILSRLPGLRVLSVDLGHRYAAACAVWETLSSNSMRQACRDKGHPEPSESDLFIHLYRKVEKERIKGSDKGKVVEITETAIYRRIGEDFLRDPKTGKPTAIPHPAPWARLDRQFLIKLPGEDQPARAASSKPDHGINETALVAAMARDLCFLRDCVDDVHNRGADDLMQRAVRIATLGLKRHGRVAKIAYALNPQCPGIPGAGGEIKAVTRGDEAHIRLLANALTDWHALATDTDWDGATLRTLWNSLIGGLADAGFEITEPKVIDSNAERLTRAERKKQDENLRNRIEPIASRLAKADPSATEQMHVAWTALWVEADGKSAGITKTSGGGKGPPRTTVTSPATGWYARLRLLSDWIMGWHLPGALSNIWNRNVGGLSLMRIATMRSLYQLHKAFDMRPQPQKVQGAPIRGEENSGTAQTILDAMERMREQRVKQLASRIAASALGLGGHWKTLQRRDNKGRPLFDQSGKPRMKRVWVEEPSPKYPACHAIVIESLTNYRPDELQTRRENRQLMVWSSSKVKKYLSEACQLHGLHLREVTANYTSQQDSRTGSPGLRCEDAPVDGKTGEVLAYWWTKAFGGAKKR